MVPVAPRPRARRRCLAEHRGPGIGNDQHQPDGDGGVGRHQFERKHQLQVGVRVDPTSVWEVSNTDNGLTPQSIDTGVGGTPAGLTGRIRRPHGGHARTPRRCRRHDGNGQPDGVPRSRTTGSEQRDRSRDIQRSTAWPSPSTSWHDRPQLAGIGSRDELRGTECDHRGDPDADRAGLPHDPRPRLHRWIRLHPRIGIHGDLCRQRHGDARRALFELRVRRHRPDAGPGWHLDAAGRLRLGRHRCRTDDDDDDDVHGPEQPIPTTIPPATPMAPATTSSSTPTRTSTTSSTSSTLSTSSQTNSSTTTTTTG